MAMCRFVAYHGAPIGLDELLYKPEHSIIHQSTHAFERDEPLNGDGWGVGWYTLQYQRNPALYRTVRPAWSDDNMRNISPSVRTPVFLSHVRAASPGLAVQQLNCHPFQGGQPRRETDDVASPVERGRRRLLFMHNGKVGAYREIIRRLHRKLPDDLFFGVRGTTDSELAFAVFQDYLGQYVIEPSVDEFQRAMQDMLGYMNGLKTKVATGEETTDANMCVTDGKRLLATRYAHPDPDDAPSLYVATADRFYCGAGGEFDTINPEGNESVLVASERLFDDERVWQRVPLNHAVRVSADGTVSLEELNVAS
jgi:predicted glutamine amidotransferase